MIKPQNIAISPLNTKENTDITESFTYIAVRIITKIANPVPIAKYRVLTRSFPDLPNLPNTKISKNTKDEPKKVINKLGNDSKIFSSKDYYTNIFTTDLFLVLGPICLQSPERSIVDKLSN